MVIGTCDGWVILGIVLCIASVVFSCAYAWYKRDEESEE